MGTITESRQCLVVALAHVGAGALAGLPFQLPVQLGLKVSDPLLVYLAVPLAGPVHLQDFAVQPVDFSGPGLVDLLLTVGLDEGPAEGVLVAVEVIVGFLDLGVLEGEGLEPGASFGAGRRVSLVGWPAAPLFPTSNSIKENLSNVKAFLKYFSVNLKSFI